MPRLTKGYKTGKAQELWKCPREIRICCPNKLGEIYECSDWGRGEVEYWMLIKINKKDYNKNIMQRIFKKDGAQD